jgi:transcription initiation factor TFIID subunit 7
VEGYSSFCFGSRNISTRIIAAPAIIIIMGDRLPIRDRTLILRILVPGLEQRLRDKMKEVEEDANGATIMGPVGGSSTTPSSTTSTHNNHNNNNNNNNNKETLLDLDGVMCEPTQDGSTLWNFHCDGATYPARLVNLPCPVEIHKTHDHAMYYKSCDIAQMLIVYEDSMALDEADAYPKTDEYPSYYHSVSWNRNLNKYECYIACLCGLRDSLESPPLSHSFCPFI